MDHPCGRKVLGGHVTIIEHSWGPWESKWLGEPGGGSELVQVRSCKIKDCGKFEVKMQRYRRSLRRENEVAAEALKKGYEVYKLKPLGRSTKYSLVTIDVLDRQVTFIEVKSHRGSTFRVDRDVRSYPEFGMMTRRVTYDGKVKA